MDGGRAKNAHGEPCSVGGPERGAVRDQYDQPRTRGRVRRGDSVVVRRENRRGGRRKRQ